MVMGIENDNVLQIRWDRGHMIVILDEFVASASVSKMKKLIKLIDLDQAADYKKASLRMWLVNQKSTLAKRIEAYKNDIGEAQNRLNKAKNFYEYHVYIRDEMRARIPEEHKQLIKDAYSAFRGAQTSERYLRSRCRKTEKLEEKISKMLELF